MSRDDSRIVSTLICSSGGANGGGSSYEPAPETDCPALADPLTSRPAPALSGCTFTDLVISTSQQLPGNAVFCGGLKIEKGAIVTLSPGIYVISGGKLEVKDTSKLIGDYVSFYFQDDAAVFTFDKDTTIDLSAPKDGELAGMLFFENPLATDGRIFTIRSEHAQRLLGTIYLPGGKLEIDSKANVADAIRVYRDRGEPDPGEGRKPRRELPTTAAPTCRCRTALVRTPPWSA